MPIPGGMTASTPALETWAVRPVGKVVRVALAVFGMVFATMVLTSAVLVETGSWALVLIGVALAATSVRAAQQLTTTRLAALAAVLLAIPLSIQIF